MRGDSPRQSRGDADGRGPPAVHPNGGQPPPLGTTAQLDSLHPPVTNGAAAGGPHGRTSSFSYSSILASSPAVTSPGGDGVGGNNHTNHEKPFKYSKDEILGIWKSNAPKLKSSGLPLEFERHDTFTSEEALDPVLLTEMANSERDVLPPRPRDLV